MIRIFDKKLKKIHMIFFELLPFFKIVDPEIPQLDTVLKLHVWIPHGKIADAYFLGGNYLPL